MYNLQVKKKHNVFENKEKTCVDNDQEAGSY